MGQSTQQQVVSNKTGQVATTTSDASYVTTERVISAGLNGSAAFSGGFSLGGSAGSRKTTHQSSGLSQAEADRLYEERIQDEYAKREGGA